MNPDSIKDEIVFRPYCSTDCDRIIKLFYDTVHFVNAADYSPRQLSVWATGTECRKDWDASLLEHNTVVAVLGDMIVGFGDIAEDGYLDRLYVHKSYQRKGIATAICDILEKECPKITTYASITAKPFFLARGYRVVRENIVVRKGVKLKNYFMTFYLVGEDSHFYKW